VLAISAASESTTAECNLSGEQELRRDLRRPQVLAIVVGAIVGTGIYIRPASIAQFLGSPALIIGIWLVGGMLTLCGALTYARLAMLVPGTGGEYLFLRTTLGRLPAFLYGWMRLTVGPAVIAGMAVACTVFLNDIVTFKGAWIHAAFPWWDGEHFVDFGPRQTIAVTLILGLAWINTRGVGRAGSFQLLVTICKVVGLLMLLAAIALFSHSPTGLTPLPLPLPTQDTSPLAYGGALLAVMASYAGWHNVAIMGGEVRDAERTIPWALVAGILIVAGLYVTTNEAFLHTLSFHEIATANSANYPDAPSVASLAVNRSLGPRAATVLPLLFALSALGTAHCNLLVIPRVFLSMARDGLLPTYITRVSPHSATPNRAIWTASIIAAAFAVGGSYDRLTNMTTFAYLAFYALTTAGFLWSCHRSSPNERDISFWAMIIVAILFLLGTSALIAVSIARGSIEVLTATALISSGIPVFAAVKWLRGKSMERVAAR
jgi:APA family basic amino acid/polyamine antiporter